MNAWIDAPTGRYPAARTTTDAAGAYSLPVTPGTYKLQVVPPGTGSAAAGWWTGTGPVVTIGAATPIVVVAGPAQTASLTLGPAVYLTGTVVGPSSTPVVGGTVSLYVAGDPTGGWTQFVLDATTDASGAFTAPLPPGTYRAQVRPPFGARLETRWYNTVTPAYRYGLAQDIPAPSGSVALGTITLAATYLITGTVSDAAGAPIASVVVQAYLGGTAGCCDPSDYAPATTDAAGRYSLTVRSGSYRIEFRPPPGYLRAFWSATVPTGAADFATASDVVVGTTDQIANTTLASGFIISGRVTRASDATPVAYSGVNAMTSTSTRVVAFGSTDANGAYTLTVPAGTYRLRAGAPYADMTVATSWWNGKIDYSVGTDLVVAANVTAIDFALPPGYSVSGRIADATGAPIVGASVWVMHSPDPGVCPCFAATSTARTDATGNYLLNNVPSGTYRLVFQVGATIYYRISATTSTTNPSDPAITTITVSGVSLAAVDTRTP